MGDNRGSPWERDPALEGRLRELVADSRSGAEIAKALKVSRNTVIGKVHRLGLKLKGESAAQMAGKRKARKPKAVVPEAVGVAWAEPSAPRRFSWQDQPSV